MQSSTETSRSPAGPIWVGILLMLAVSGFQAGGIGASTAMWALYGSAFIVGIGTPVFGLIVRGRYGRRPSAEWTETEKDAIRRLTVGNLGVNLGWPFAGLMIGLGAASSIMALGPVSVGLRDDKDKKRLKPIFLRVGMLVCIVVATKGWELFIEPSWWTVLGVVAAACGGWHFWNVAKCLDIYEQHEDEKRDRLMLASNKRAAPIIVGVAVGVGMLTGNSLVAGEFTVVALLKMIGLGAIAALCVFVAGIIFTNRAKRYLSAPTQGLMFAFGPVVSGIIGDIGGRFGLIQGNQELSLINWIGIVGVSVFAFWTANVQKKINEAKVDAAVPEQRLAAPVGELDGTAAEQETGVALEGLCAVFLKLIRQRDAAVADRERLQAELNARDAAVRVPENPDWLEVESYQGVEYTRRGKRFASAKGVTLRYGRRTVELAELKDGFFGDDGQLKGGMVTSGVVMIDGDVVDWFGRGWAMKASCVGLSFKNQERRLPSSGSAAEGVPARK